MILDRTLALVALSLCACSGPAALAPPASPPVTQEAPVASPSPSPEPGPEPKPAPEPDYAAPFGPSVPAELIARFAPPPLPQDVTRRIQAMLDVRGTPSGHLTRRGDRMLFHWNITGSLQVFRQDGPMAFPVQLTGGEDRTLVAALAPDDSFAVISRDIGGAENPGLYLASLEGGPLRAIQHKDLVQTSLMFVADDSMSLVYRANDVDPGSYALYRWDVTSGAAERVFDTKGLWSIADHRGAGPSEEWLLVKALGNTHFEVYRYAVATRELSPLLGQGEAEDYSVRYGAGPGEILVRTNKLGDFHRIYALAGDGGALVPLTPEVAHDVSSFTIDRARTRIFYTLNEGGFVRLYALDAKTKRPIALPKLPAADNTWIAGVSRDGRFAHFMIDGARLPPTMLVHDFRTRKTTAWQRPSTPEIDPSSFAEISLERCPVRDGSAIPLLVRRPAACVGASPPCPVIVDFHGGPESQATADFSGTAQLFVDAGFVLVEPNVRGSSGYGKTYLHADNGALRKQIITDIEDVALHLRKSWAVSGVAPKIGVSGGSYGGYSTLMAMTYFAGAYDAGVSRVGISNLVTFIRNTAPYRRILRMAEYGDPDRDEAVMLELSPTTHIERLRAPLLVIQGVNDPRVPVGEALQFYRKLEQRGVPGGLILFADEGHGTSKRPNQVSALGHTLAFFEQHLK